MDKSTVINRLSAWARWKLISGHALGYPKASSFTHLVVDGTRRNIDVAEIDSWCIETDDAVCDLERNDKELYFVVRVEYLSNVKDIGTKIAVTGLNCRSTYYRRLNTAYKLIGVIIEKKACMLETSMV